MTWILGVGERETQPLHTQNAALATPTSSRPRRSAALYLLGSVGVPGPWQRATAWSGPAGSSWPASLQAVGQGSPLQWRFLLSSLCVGPLPSSCPAEGSRPLSRGRRVWPCSERLGRRFSLRRQLRGKRLGPEDPASRPGLACIPAVAVSWSLGSQQVLTCSDRNSAGSVHVVKAAGPGVMLGAGFAWEGPSPGTPQLKGGGGVSSSEAGACSLRSGPRPPTRASELSCPNLTFSRLLNWDGGTGCVPGPLPTGWHFLPRPKKSKSN